mgnify:CR=1 FL=1
MVMRGCDYLEDYYDPEEYNEEAEEDFDKIKCPECGRFYHLRQKNVTFLYGDPVCPLCNHIPQNIFWRD